MDPSSAPLADYFWIAGIDSLSYGQHIPHTRATDDRAVNGASSPSIGSTIEEDKALEDNDSITSPTSPRQNGATSDREDPFHRLSSLSNEARLSIQSISSDPKIPASNRSSMTIRAVQIDNTNGSGLSDVDFDIALKKFAMERETFLDELSFSAGTVEATRPKKHPRTQKIAGEANATNRDSTGGLRRHFSFRDLNSVKRQPSMARTSSVRTSRRLSNYNSVIPAPQPINDAPNMHPLKRKFEPVLLDRYPTKTMTEEVQRRGPFPDYIPMFAFPNDVSIVSADERPRSTWHGFAMTSGDNSRLHGICVIMWLPLNRQTAEEVERQCEQWRRDNMTNEERELANSLGERLVLERAKLSQLLAQLPSVPSGSDERDALEDEIGAVEEKIGLMTDLLRPVRHGAASKIDGLTDGETGLWIPRAYGILGRDANLTSFWKEWLRAVIVPMTNGGVLRVPPSSPKVGMWQPLERYVVNLCAEAMSPISSKTQMEIAVRELRLYARKEAANELPGSRNTDLYALFRALPIPDIVSLFECVLAESRIILLSSHTAMLYLVSRALVALLYPLTWSGVFIPILPARLISALEAPCPYIVGVETRYDKIQFPEDDIVVVDLDQGTVEATNPPPTLPRQQRRKLTSLLQVAAPHHNRFGVPVGPPPYAVETYPLDSFSSENWSIFESRAPKSTLSKFVGLNSAAFADPTTDTPAGPPIFNVFLHAKQDPSRFNERPTTSSTMKDSSPPSPKLSPTSSHFPSLPSTSISRHDSAQTLTTTLREKRSGHFDAASRRSSSLGNFERVPPLRRPSIPFSHHSSSASTSTLSSDAQSNYRYAPSTYAASTLAASTIMPNVLMQPVQNTDTTSWVEGHCMLFRSSDDRSICSICEEKADGGIYKCTGCSIHAHARCLPQICLVCPVAFHPDQIRAAFVRCFASLFYTYRKFMHSASGESKKAGKVYRFDIDGFMRSVPHENSDYLRVLRQTQGFDEFIHEREMKRSSDLSILLFDQIILAKKNRGRTAFFSKSNTSFLSDSSDHLWRSAAALPPSSRFPGDYRQITSRIPAKLDPTLMKEPRAMQGVPRISTANFSKRKPIPSMLGPRGSSGVQGD